MLHAPATMITHAGASDLPILERAVGARPTALFDVQLAAGFVGLGLPSLGSLVSVLLGVRLDKSEQLADWSVRPLSPAVRKYAAADVEYLFPLTMELDHRLQDRGREAWAASECEQLRKNADRRVDPDVAWWRIKGASSLRGEKARVAQSVAAWRERHAQRLDLVPRFVLPDLAMAAVVGRPPKSRDDVMKLRGVNRMSSEIARRAARRGRSGAGDAGGELRMPDKPDDGPELEAAVALLVAYVAEIARAQRIEKQLLATRDDVKALVHGRPEPPRLRLAGRGRRRPSSAASSTARPSSASPTAAATSASRVNYGEPASKRANNRAASTPERKMRGQRPGAVRTPRCERWESTDRADMLDSTDANDANEPTENADSAEPTEPIDANDPIEPMENDDPADAIEQNEFVDHSEKPVRRMSVPQGVGGELGAEALIVARTEVRRHVAGEQLERAVPPVDGHPLPRVEQQRAEPADRLVQLADLRDHVLG